jgi:hypothetical protein
MSRCREVRGHPAVPLEPVEAILEALRSHAIVALDAGDHGNEQGHAFRLSLVRDPDFAMTVNDIVVEFGNALYQDVIDRFAYGEDVASASLRRVWQNTTQPHFAVDLPIYEEFFRAVRAVNLSVAAERRVRVLLGDPPIDWETVQTVEDHARWLMLRDTHAADLIRREVLARQRRALVIYGGWHLQRKNRDSNYEPSEGAPLVALLNTSANDCLFTVWTNTMADLEALQPDIAAWRKPSLAMLRGTVLGAADFSFYFPFDGARFIVRNGTPQSIPRRQWRTLRMEDQFDAVLYLGSPSSITQARLSPLYARIQPTCKCGYDEWP